MTGDQIEVAAPCAGRGKGNKVAVRAESRLFVTAGAKGDLAFQTREHVLYEYPVSEVGHAAESDQGAVRRQIGLGIIRAALADAGDGPGIQILQTYYICSIVIDLF